MKIARTVIFLLAMVLSTNLFAQQATRETTVEDEYLSSVEGVIPSPAKESNAA